jgi:hypothetical protein
MNRKLPRVVALAQRLVSSVLLASLTSLTSLLTSACTGDVPDADGRTLNSLPPGQQAPSGTNGAVLPAGPSRVGPGGTNSPTLPVAPGTVSTPGMCAEGSARVTPVTPTVWLVVDGSSSMNTEFGAGVSRWQTLRDTLMGPMGIVASLEASVRFGMVIYSGGGGSGECVNLVTVEPALTNYAALNAMYPMDPIGQGTPTDKALDEVFAKLPMAGVAMPGVATDPVYVVLATDGSPNDTCGDSGGGGGPGGGGQVEQRVLDSTVRGTQQGANVFIISLAGSDTRLQMHLDAVAMVTASAMPPFVPATQADLIAAFRAVVGGGTCQVTLNGSVASGQECTGMVVLDAQPLTCDSDNGWRLTGPSMLQLTGTACDTFLGGMSEVRANFPCGVFIPD